MHRTSCASASTRRSPWRSWTSFFGPAAATRRMGRGPNATTPKTLTSTKRLLDIAHSLVVKLVFKVEKLLVFYQLLKSRLQLSLRHDSVGRELGARGRADAGSACHAKPDC